MGKKLKSLKERKTHTANRCSQLSFGSNEFGPSYVFWVFELIKNTITKYQQTFEVNLLTEVGGRDTTTSKTYTDIVSPSEMKVKVAPCLLMNRK